MAAPTNFITWNPNQVNQQSDVEYLGAPQREGGAVSGLFAARLANKLFYQCSVMVAALAQAMVNKGYEMQDVVIGDLVTSFSHILTDAQFGTGPGTVCQGNDIRLISPIPVGTKAWFYQNVAPTGWTIDATVNDAVLAVRSVMPGTAYNVTGGNHAGNWEQPTHLHTSGGHTLTPAEMPIHSHGCPVGVSGGAGGRTTGATNVGFYDTTTAGGGLSHNHGNTGLSGPSPTWRPYASVGIICTKS